MPYLINPLGKDELRRRAGDRLSGHTHDGTGRMSAAEMRLRLEALTRREIELELQNDYLEQVRMQLDAALNASTELFDFAPVGLLNLDGSARVVRLNLAAARLLGESRAGLIGRLLPDCLDAASADRFTACLARALTERGAQQAELSLSADPGTLRHLQAYLTNLSDGAGVYLALVDITEHHERELRYQRDCQHLQTAIDAVGDGLWDYQIQAARLSFSPRFAALMGFPGDCRSLDLEACRQLVHPADWAALLASTRNHLAGNTPALIHCYRSKIAKSPGGWRWMMLRGAVVERGPKGGALRMTGTLAAIDES